jgi:hypothetical protein
MRPEVYEAIRVGLSHEVVLKNILNFIQLRDRLGAGRAGINASSFAGR